LFDFGVITDEISNDLKHALAVCREYDVRQAELRVVGDANLVDLAPEAVREAKDVIDGEGFAVPCLATPLFKCDLPGTHTGETGPMHAARARTMDDQMELLKRCCDLAHLFGAPIIRVFAFWRTEATPEALARMAEAFQEPLAYAAQEKLILGLENEHSCILGTGRETADFVASVNHPNLKIVWDPGNAFIVEETPYPDGYVAVKPHLCHVHIKDVRRRRDGSAQFAVVGEGEVDYAGQFRALIDDGYAGVMSLETHYRPPSGSAELGSRLCLDGMRKILAEVGAA
jgi:sugar phosphate isomerase/epimerase